MITLEAKAYAVLAHHARNAERSNWLGKSGFLEAIRFALSGWHRHRLDDAWITEGEKQGGVTLTLEDGTVISRTRKRGKATQLTVSGGARKEDAQHVIDELIGLTERDFLATCYFEQGQMSRFITQESSKRTETVSAWFQLEPLLAVEEIHATKLAQLTWDATTFRRALQTAEEFERAELSGFESFDALIQARQTLTSKLEQKKLELNKAREHLAANRQAIAISIKRDGYNSIVEEGIKLRNIVDQIDANAVRSEHETADDLRREAGGRRAAAASDLDTKRRRLVHKFDGNCPVVQMQCPAKDQINRRADDLKLTCEAARIEFEAAVRQENEANTRYNNADANAQSLTRANARLQLLRDQATKLLDEIDDSEVDETAPTQDTIDRILTSVQDMTGMLAVYERSIGAIEKARGERLRLAQQLSALEMAITTEREAKAIVGRNGAQRRIAEVALSQIEQGANQMLRDCAIDLQVGIRWSREGTTIANACEECGHPFPKTAKVKHCERCNAPRGMNIINKLDIELSNVSGAAKDLAGAAFQLAASRWMRQHRKTRWSVAVLDEPFGQLDAANRKAFSQHLAALLRSRYGFEQSFCVAHHSAVLDALPGRIEIESDGKRSTIRVAA